IDNLINAPTRAFKCYRVPINAYYQNDRRVLTPTTEPLVSSFMECAPHVPFGCTRCNVPSSSICCELCNPKLDHPSSIFTQYTSSSMVENSSTRSVSRQSTLSKFVPGPIDYELRRSLDAFRCEAMQKRHGPAVARNLGPVDIMSDVILERIAACARFKKILSLDDLQREVPKWLRILEYGPEVLTIIHR
ncbi:hypothetical protein BDY19DRAFT_863082, partial [Irpex rosettiformis]